MPEIKNEVQFKVLLAIRQIVFLANHYPDVWNDFIKEHQDMAEKIVDIFSGPLLYEEQEQKTASSSSPCATNNRTQTPSKTITLH